MRTTPREVQDFNSIKKSFSLSEKQRTVLFGTLLGDGSLKRRGNYHRLHIKHSRNQISLVEYKRRVFSNITNMRIRNFFQEVKGKSYGFSEFVTLTHPEFTNIYKKIYPGEKKRITQEFLSEFKDPLGLAVWFMDDGCADYAGVAFNTQCFTKEGIEILRSFLRDQFKLDTTSRRNKNGWIIYIPKRMLNRFINLVDDNILERFKYKLQPYSTRI